MISSSLHCQTLPDGFMITSIFISSLLLFILLLCVLVAKYLKNLLEELKLETKNFRFVVVNKNEEEQKEKFPSVYASRSIIFVLRSDEWMPMMLHCVFDLEARVVS